MVVVCNPFVCHFWVRSWRAIVQRWWGEGFLRLRCYWSCAHRGWASPIVREVAVGKFGVLLGKGKELQGCKQLNCWVRLSTSRLVPQIEVRLIVWQKARHEDFAFVSFPYGDLDSDKAG
ncbi:hypothetical protein SLA2020_406890 [Shorea laevis]